MMIQIILSVKLRNNNAHIYIDTLRKLVAWGIYFVIMLISQGVKARYLLIFQKIFSACDEEQSIVLY